MNDEATGSDKIQQWVQCARCDKWRRLQCDEATVAALAEDWHCGDAPLGISCKVPEDEVDSSETDAGDDHHPDQEAVQEQQEGPSRSAVEDFIIFESCRPTLG